MLFRSYYQKALAIYVEFGDRYEPAKTYYCLGWVAEELGELEVAKTNFLQACQIFVEFHDEDRLQLSIRALSRVYRATKDDSILKAIADIFGISIKEAQQKLR